MIWNNFYKSKVKLLQFMFNRLYNVSLRVKMIGLVIFTAIFIGVLMILEIYFIFPEFNTIQLRELSTSMSKELSLQSVNYILDDNMFQLTKLLKDAVISNPDLIYAFIENNKGRVIASNFSDGFPLVLLKINNKHFQSQSVLNIKTTNANVWDTKMPILKGELGIVRVGISAKRSGSIITSLIGSVAFAVVIAIIVGVIISSIIAWFIMMPIADLSKAAKAIGNGKYIKVQPSSSDELGELISTFNEMSNSLRMLESERNEKESMRREFVSKVINAQEEERKRIARDLHDQLGQFLTYTKIKFKILEDLNDVFEIHKNVIALRDDLTKEVGAIHDMAEDLRPSTLDVMGLENTVSMYVDDFVKKYDISVNFYSINLNDKRFSNVIEISIYRVVQEALRNIIKHAKAKTVKVILEYNKDHIRGVIEDDGEGFNYEENLSKGLGIYGMRERVELLKGRLDIESEVDHGSMIVFDIPVQ